MLQQNATINPIKNKGVDCSILLIVRHLASTLSPVVKTPGGMSRIIPGAVLRKNQKLTVPLSCPDGSRPPVKPEYKPAIFQTRI